LANSLSSCYLQAKFLRDNEIKQVDTASTPNSFIGAMRVAIGIIRAPLSRNLFLVIRPDSLDEVVHFAVHIQSRRYGS
jgi:3-oxoacyl-[acyl-carrier-protein] synthase III